MPYNFRSTPFQLRSVLHNKLISGTLLLTFTGILTRCIGFFYKIFLSRSIGAEALGIYQLVFPIFMFALSICCGGIQTAISRYTAHSDQNSRIYLHIGLLLSAGLAMSASFLIRQNAYLLSNVFLQEPACEKLLQTMALAIPFACIHSCINAYYYGIKKASIPSLSQLIEQITRVIGVYIIFLILEDMQQPATAQAAIWGILIGELSSALLSATALQMQKKKQQKTSSTLLSLTCSCRTACKQLVSLAFPLTCNRIALSLAQSIENVFIPISLKMYGYSSSEALSLYGILTGMALASVMMPAVLSNSLSVMLLPEISKAQADQDVNKIRLLIRKTVEFSIIIGFLCILIFLLCGNFAGNCLFHNHLAGVYIRILSWICPFLFLTGTLNSILQGLGKPKPVLFTNLSASIIRILFVLLAIPSFGIKSYLWGILVSQVTSALLSFLALKKQVL